MLYVRIHILYKWGTQNIRQLNPILYLKSLHSSVISSVFVSVFVFVVKMSELTSIALAARVLSPVSQERNSS